MLHLPQGQHPLSLWDKSESVHFPPSRIQTDISTQNEPMKNCVGNTASVNKQSNQKHNHHHYHHNSYDHHNRHHNHKADRDANQNVDSKAEK